jgi:hypothetical protein
MWPTTVGGLDGVGTEVAPQHGADGGQGPSGSRRVGRRDLAGGCRGNRGAVHGTTGADGGGIRPALSCAVAGQRVKNGWAWEQRKRLDLAGTSSMDIVETSPADAKGTEVLPT